MNDNIEEKEWLNEFNNFMECGEAYSQDIAKDRLAVESEVSRSTIERIFKGEDNIGLCTLHRAVRALGYKSVLEFLGEL